MTSIYKLLCSAVLTLPLLATAQAQSYPGRPVTIVVPYAAGGSVDGVARVLATELSEHTGGSFVVDNRAGGAGGVVGSAEVQRAAPDGYTLLLNASIHVVVPLINDNVPFDVVEDFAHVAGIASGPLLITTHPSVQADTLEAFFSLVRADPDAYTLATSSYGSAGHLTLEVLTDRADVDADILAYPGAAPALNDLIGGQVHLLADPLMSSLPHVRAGRLKALAVTSAQRSVLAPDIPTVEESGLGTFDLSSWYGLWAPADLDPDVAAFLEQAVEEVVTSESFRERLAVFGFEPTYRGSEALKNFVVQESARYREIVEAAGIRVEQ